MHGQQSIKIFPKKFWSQTCTYRSKYMHWHGSNDQISIRSLNKVNNQKGVQSVFYDNNEKIKV